ESVLEFLEQMLRARVAVRLKGDQQAARAQTFQGLERRRDFVRMMTVIVEQPKPVVGEQFLLAPRCAAKRRDGAGDVRGRKSQLVQERNDRRTVGQVLFAQQPGGEPAEALAVVPDVKASGGERVGGWIRRRFR